MIFSKFCWRNQMLSSNVIAVRRPRLCVLGRARAVSDLCVAVLFVVCIYCRRGEADEASDGVCDACADAGRSLPSVFGAAAAMDEKKKRGRRRRMRRRRKTPCCDLSAAS
jgi:hypothetical protein